MAESHRILKTSTNTADRAQGDTLGATGNHSGDPVPGSSSTKKEDMIIQVEGGVPIVSGPTNVNLRSFYVSNPYASNKPKGPRSGKNVRDPKFNPRAGCKKVTQSASDTVVNVEQSVTNGPGSADSNTTDNRSSSKCTEVPSCSTSNQIDLKANRSKSEVTISPFTIASESALPNNALSNDLAEERKRRNSEATVILCKPTSEFKLVSYSDSSDGEEEVIKPIKPIKPSSVPTPLDLDPPKETPIPPRNGLLKKPNPTTPQYEDMLVMAEQFRKKKVVPSVPTVKHNSMSSIAAEFKKMVQELAAQDLKERGGGRKRIALFDYFESIYGLAFIRTPSPPANTNGMRFLIWIIW
jgi:hypothetical protein